MLEQWKQTLQENGGRLTQPRLAILEILFNSQHPLTAVEVYETARERVPNLGLVTVYRTIDTLEAHNLIDRIHGRDNCHAFFRSSQEHRHLISCTACGRSTYFDALLAEKDFDQIGEQTGFKINDHTMQLFGLCTSCQAKNHER